MLKIYSILTSYLNIYPIIKETYTNVILDITKNIPMIDLFFLRKKKLYV